MNTGKYIFAQLIEFLPQRIFDRIVMKYERNKYVKHFTCWNQLLVMMFGQLSNRDLQVPYLRIPTKSIILALART